MCKINYCKNCQNNWDNAFDYDFEYFDSGCKRWQCKLLDFVNEVILILILSPFFIGIIIKDFFDNLKEKVFK